MNVEYMVTGKLKPVFLGLSFSIKEDRSGLDVCISVNDGFFSIDSEVLSYEIVLGRTFKMYNHEKMYRKPCVGNLGCVAFPSSGIIELPKSLICEHDWKAEYDGGRVIEVRKELKYIEDIDELPMLDMKELVESFKICVICGRVKDIVVRKTKATEIYGMGNIYDKYNTCLTFIDCSYEMIYKILRTMGDVIFSWVSRYSENNNYKIVTAGFSEILAKYPEVFNMTKRKFWLEFDAYPCILDTDRDDYESRADSLARKGVKLIGFNNLLRLDIDKDNEVNVDSSVISFCSLVDYKEYLGTEYSRVLDDIVKFKSNFNDKRIGFFSSTPQGGGVALMRHAHVRFYRLLGMGVSWYVTIPVPSVYKITKQKIHNVLQGVAPEDEDFTEEDKFVYEEWCKMNAERCWQKKIFKILDIIILDDYQTSGLTKYIRMVNKDVKIIYRSHIQIKSELYGKNKTFTKVWDYISSNIENVDYFISHPVPEFVPSNIDKSKVFYLPPSTDPLDGLNKNMKAEISSYYVEIFKKYALDAGFEPFDFSGPYITQICRIDPSKGIFDTLEVFSKLIEFLGDRHKTVDDPLYNLKLLICGHGSVDDPESSTMYAKLLDYLKTPACKNIAEYVICLIIPPLDQILNLLLSNAKVCLQLSLSEGFEIKVSESILKNVPVIIYDNGGLPQQVLHGKTGYIVKSGDIDQVVKYLMELLESNTFSRNMIKYKESNLLYTTPYQVFGWMKIF
ncbi:Glycosyl transferase, partial [Spraguea lophii 42_110]